MNTYVPDLWSAVNISIKIGVCCVLIGLPIAVPLGWVLARKSFAGKSLLATLCMAPVVLPPVVCGFLLLTWLGGDSFLGRLLSGIGLQVPFTFAGAVLAALVVGLPFYIMGARAAFENVDPQYEDIARTCGKTPWQTFVRVSLPLAMPGISAGALLAFARAFGEFGATVVVAGNLEGETRSIALAVYTLLESPDGMSEIWNLVGVSLGLAFVALMLYEVLMRWQRRRLSI